MPTNDTLAVKDVTRLTRTFCQKFRALQVELDSLKLHMETVNDLNLLQDDTQLIGDRWQRLDSGRSCSELQLKEVTAFMELINGRFNNQNNATVMKTIRRLCTKAMNIESE